MKVRSPLTCSHRGSLPLLPGGGVSDSIIWPVLPESVAGVLVADELNGHGPGA